MSRTTIKSFILSSAIAGTCLWSSPFLPPASAADSTSVGRGAATVTGMRTLKNIFYTGAKSNSQSMDIYLPDGSKKPAPVIVWIHGGSWSGGSKEECPPVYFVSSGFAAVSINYRLSQEAAYPAQLYDCKSAIHYLRQHAKDLNIDAARIGVWGASAGGHLAALLGTTGNVSSWETPGHKPGASSKVQAVCNWCGPSDLRDMHRKLATKQVTLSQVEPIYRLLANRVTPDWLTAASPISYVSAKTPPFLIMHGDQDATVPVDQSRYFHQVLKTRKIDSTLYVLKGAGHSFSSSDNARIVLEFFKRVLQARTISLSVCSEELVA